MDDPPRFGFSNHFHISTGTVWVRSAGHFNFLYRFPKSGLRPYISFEPGKQPQGIFIDFINTHNRMDS